ncbi:MAG: phage tail protein [Blastocatellia bacterium AA13]|nr:MAG: phage tail protein [Blastocatellia bacterium AA13]
MAEDYYPPGGFYFTVKVLGSATALSLLTDIDASFQEISGVQAEWDTEEVVEGGENRFVHRLPRPAKYSNLVLKRGIVTKGSFLSEWFGLTIGSALTLPIIPQNLLVMLLNDNGWPTNAWIFVNAYPLRWDVGPFNSMDNKILIETLELSYNYFQRINVNVEGAAAALAALTLAVARLAV